LANVPSAFSSTTVGTCSRVGPGAEHCATCTASRKSAHRGEKAEWRERSHWCASDQPPSLCASTCALRRARTKGLMVAIVRQQQCAHVRSPRRARIQERRQRRRAVRVSQQRPAATKSSVSAIASARAHCELSDARARWLARQIRSSRGRTRRSCP
jgi:hypothetical protein